MDDFNEAMFKTKVDNMFVKLLTAVMKGDLTEVDHFISDDGYHKYEDIINNPLTDCKIGMLNAVVDLLNTKFEGWRYR